MQESSFLKGFKFEPFSPASRTGLYVNPTAEISIPIHHDILFVNEADLYFGQKSRQNVEQLAAQIAQKHQQYAEFVRRKGRRGNGDIYATFQPFNEASKAFYPFVHALRKRLPPGGIILNLWDRSTWFSSLLPALFPEQTVLTTWEGDKNVLGYGGYDFWMTQKDGYTNSQLIFCAPDQPLPLEAHSVDLVFALDAFHRFDQSKWIQEALRLIKPEGAILFPHTHLSNNEPEPFFERGCKQMHGRDYQAFFDRIHQTTGRRGLVLSEPGLFWFNDRKEPEHFPLESTPEMADYNATLALLPEDWNEPLEPLNF
ncbi:MAG: methyltransferase domain-containing protein, partial [Phaeodactylibacter sp.]|nr:methyltransferase domain-containing protein [Phaeodactylibacter sp.]